MGFKFLGFDFLHLDSSFSEDELLVRKTARDFVEDNLVPIIEECFRTERFPRELIPVMGELGFFGANLEGYGCAGMSNVEYGLIMQELERGDSGLRSFVSVQGALVMYPIYAYGSEEQKRNWLPRLASGQAVGCFGLTEPDFGSTPPACAPPRGAMAAIGCSTAKRRGSPTAGSPTWPWCGRAPPRVSPGSWWSAGPRAIPPATSITNGPCGPR